MASEKQSKFSEVQGGDEIRFEGQRKHKKVAAALPVGDAFTMIMIPGRDNYIRKNETTVFIKS